MRYRLQRHDGTDCSATMVPFTVLRMVPIQRYRHGNHDAAENAAIIYTFMGCCKLAQIDVRKWLNHFFTHIHDYDEDYSCDLLELLPHNLKQKGLL